MISGPATDGDPAYSVLDTPFNDVFRETMEEVRATLRPFVVETDCLISARIITLGDLFREVVAILFQAVAGVQVGLLGTVRHRSEVTNPEVDTSCFLAGCVGRLNLFDVDEVEFPPALLPVVDGTNLLQVLDGDAGAGFVLDKDVLLRFRVFLVIGTF